MNGNNGREATTTRQSMGTMSRWCLLAVAVVLLERAPQTSSFTSQYSNNRPVCGAATTTTIGERRTASVLHASSDDDDNTNKYDPEAEVMRQLARAKEVLAKSQAKLLEKEAKEAAAKDNSGDEAVVMKSEATSAAAPLPFFAAKGKVPDSQRREQMLKGTNDETGLVTADGDKMASMSETEEWESRSLSDMSFENEMGESSGSEGGDLSAVPKKSPKAADRDVVASVMNLRKLMTTEDFLKVFDKKNRFIGDLN